MRHQQGLLPFVCKDDIKMGGKKNNLKPMWDKWTKQVDLEEPTPLSDQVYLVSTQRMSAEPKDCSRKRFFRLCNLSRYDQTVTWLGEISR